MRSFIALPDSTWTCDQHPDIAAHNIKFNDRKSGASMCENNGAFVAPLDSTGGLANPAAVCGPMEKTEANAVAGKQWIRWSDNQEAEQLSELGLNRLAQKLKSFREAEPPQATIGACKQR